MISTASVVICTHNPRLDYLDRVLAALKGQTLPFDQWELLLIDNASTPPLATVCNLGWHPNYRYVVEEELGLTPARLRGINESSGDLIVFVDDDNVLATDYLERAIQIASDHLHIGAFGGSVKAEFETTPEPWALPYLHLLAIREIERDSWSNLLNGWNESTPFGAGLCVKRPVAQDYVLKVLSNNKRRALDRVGTGTGSFGDADLAYCSIDLGMGMGTFYRLKLIHLISKGRLRVEYIARLSAGIYGSRVVLESLRPSSTRSSQTAGRLAAARDYVKLFLCSAVDRKIALAIRQGRRKGERFLRESARDTALIQS